MKLTITPEELAELRARVTELENAACDETQSKRYRREAAPDWRLSATRIRFLIGDIAPRLRPWTEAEPGRYIIDTADHGRIRTGTPSSGLLDEIKESGGAGALAYYHEGQWRSIKFDSANRPGDLYATLAAEAVAARTTAYILRAYLS